MYFLGVFGLAEPSSSLLLGVLFVPFVAFVVNATPYYSNCFKL
jgi:hypothetical protein